MRLDNDGDVIWSNTYGTENVYEGAWEIIETDEGDSVAVGWTSGTRRVWVVKVDFDGDIIWSRERQPYRTQLPCAIVSSDEGGFAIAGQVYDERQT